MVTSEFRPEVEIRLFRACTIKIRNITLIYGRIAEISASKRKLGSRIDLGARAEAAKVQPKNI